MTAFPLSAVSRRRGRGAQGGAERRPVSPCGPLHAPCPQRPTVAPGARRPQPLRRPRPRRLGRPPQALQAPVGSVREIPGRPPANCHPHVPIHPQDVQGRRVPCVDGPHLHGQPECSLVEARPAPSPPRSSGVDRLRHWPQEPDRQEPHQVCRPCLCRPPPGGRRIRLGRTPCPLPCLHVGSWRSVHTHGADSAISRTPWRRTSTRPAA